MSVFDVEFDKNLNFGGYFGQKSSFCGLDAPISNAKTDPFVPIGAYLVVYLKHIGIQIQEKITGKIVSCV